MIAIRLRMNLAPCPVFTEDRHKVLIPVLLKSDKLGYKVLINPTNRSTSRPTSHSTFRSTSRP